MEKLNFLLTIFGSKVLSAGWQEKGKPERAVPLLWLSRLQKH
jgi:hypothetical protein